LHPKKDSSETIPTEDGMQIDDSDEQFQNVARSREVSLERGSNVTVARDRHSEKQFGRSCSTEDGMQIDESDEHTPNA
jgi:hypothetical protein